jgi:hypothetical protein
MHRRKRRSELRLSRCFSDDILAIVES